MRRLSSAAMLLVLLAAGLVTSRSLEAQGTRLCFNVPGISNCIESRFRQYWEQNGGLAVFGYPISAAQNERNRDTGQTYLTQWFERNRFELHPENRPPYDVLLGRLGDDRLRQQGRDWQSFPKAAPTTDHYFAEAGHAIENVSFWGYWSTHGLEFDGRVGTSAAESLALFGLPISEPAMETNTSGDRVLTQWFERARFEWHPNNPPAFRVLLGLLGNEVRAGSQGTTPPPPPRSPPPPPATPTNTPVPPRPTLPPYADVPVGGDNGDLEGDLEGGVLVAGYETPLRDVPVFRTELVIQVKARLRSAGTTDGAGIDHVDIRITRISDDPSKPDESVHERTEQNAGYCAFGGGEPDCTVWVFAEHGNTWPNGKPIANGRHRVDIQIHPRDESRSAANWNFQFDIRLP